MTTEKQYEAMATLLVNEEKNAEAMRWAVLPLGTEDKRRFEEDFMTQQGTYTRVLVVEVQSDDETVVFSVLVSEEGHTQEYAVGDGNWEGIVQQVNEDAHINPQD